MESIHQLYSLKYPNIALILYNRYYAATQRTNDIQISNEAEYLAKRCFKRTKLLLERKPVLRLMKACSEFSHRKRTDVSVLNLLKLIFKDIPDEPTTETTAD